MDFDLVYVTYNSSKWIETCFESLRQVDYDKHQLHIIVVDNHSTDDTRQKLEAFKEQHGMEFGSVTLEFSKENNGFGKGNNIGFAKGSSDMVCFINVDTRVYADTFAALHREIEESGEKTAVWEFRQFPYEHPKVYDVLTGQVSWVSGAAFAIRRNVYGQLGGFDEQIFMYAEDVDLSWRLRASGYTLKYCPRVCIDHFSYESAGQVKPLQYVHSVTNNLLLRYRFGTAEDIRWWYKHFLILMLRPQEFEGSKKLLRRQLMKTLGRRKYFKRIAAADGVRFTFPGYDYEQIREGAFAAGRRSSEDICVTVVVRGFISEESLKNVVISLKRQTHKNLRLVIADKGGRLLTTSFEGITVISDEKTLDKGKYFLVVDDSALFYADFVETVLNEAIDTGRSMMEAMGQVQKTVRCQRPDGRRILVIVDRLAYSTGVGAVVLNYYRFSDHGRYPMDFVVHYPVEEEVRRDVEAGGAVIYTLPEFSFRAALSYHRKMRQIFLKKSYDIVHCHMPHRSIFYFPAARHAGIKAVVSHSHNSKGADNPIKAVINGVIRALGNRYATHFLACSDKAARFAFGRHRRVLLLNNGVDYKRFVPDSDRRAKVRAGLGVTEEFVFCHVGRFAPQKNHLFLIEAFAKAAKECPCRLLLLGDGAGRKEAEELCGRLGIAGKVFFAGECKDVENYLQAADGFVLPSIYEGLPVAVIEAQAAGMSCLVSDRVTRACNIGGCTFLPLDKGRWSEEMEALVKAGIKPHKPFYDEQFDVESTAVKLGSFYERCGE